MADAALGRTKRYPNELFPALDHLGELRPMDPLVGDSSGKCQASGGNADATLHQPCDAAAGGAAMGAVGEQLRSRFLDALDILEDCPKVQAQRAVGIGQVVGFEGVHYGSVLLNQGSHRAGVDEAHSAGTVQMGFGRVYGGPCGFVPGQPQEFPVEILIQPEKLFDVFPDVSVRLGLQNLPEPGDARAVHSEVPQ